ncbi:MAG: dual specificity protein phosphatase family protein [Bacteroidales bacterium]|nr:dual specificity protein phosphatase family protein [Bacteroidales bacterium]
MFKINSILFLFTFWWLNCFSQHNQSIKIETNLFKNLHKLNDSIFRSDQPDSLDISLLNELGIKSILNLRQHHIDESFLGKNHHFYSYHVKMRAYYLTNKQMAKAMCIIQSAPKPLLIHCKHGSDRTGAVIAMYRILYNQWTKKEALKELKSKHLGFHDIFFNIPFYIRKTNIHKFQTLINKKGCP